MSGILAASSGSSREPVQCLAHDPQFALDTCANQLVGTIAIEVDALTESLDRPGSIENVSQQSFVGHAAYTGSRVASISRMK